MYVLRNSFSFVISGNFPQITFSCMPISHSVWTNYLSIVPICHTAWLQSLINWSCAMPFDPVLCRVAQDHGTEQCRIALDHGTGLCRIAQDLHTNSIQKSPALCHIARDHDPALCQHSTRPNIFLITPFWNQLKITDYTARPYLLTKTENNYPFILAYQNQEQLPIYTGLPKPRTITHLHLLTQTENNYPFVQVIVRGFHQHYSFKRVIKTGNNYRPCGVWSSTLPI
jgi:hypothetical protein